ncbi:ABC transporter ATP-binding protein [Actinomadura miaoliensis]|uniref:ABC transporter domain-containing protein n=1 Tax=Actinomadura miaoliensis TaxID=430685 RepID=A0ABP7WLU2_9ACTN
MTSEPTGGRPAGGLAVEARGLSVRGPRGWVFRDVDLKVPAGGLAAVAGVAGSGRTSLLLTLGGRMKPASGTVLLDGRRRGLGEARRRAALGVVPGVNELDPALTVREHVSEALDLREGLLGRWRGREARIRRALERVDLGVAPRTLAADLTPEETRLLGAALALVGEPGLLLLDDVDEGLPFERQRELWRRLRALADSGVTIVAACHDAAPAEGLAQVVRLSESREEALR